MKKILSATFTAVLVISWLGYGFYSDYLWADKAKESKLKEGWIVVAERDDFGHLALPWTWLYPPVTGVWFIKPNEVKKIGDVVLVTVAGCLNDYFKTDEYIQCEMFDLANNRYSASPNCTEFTSEAIQNTEWNKCPVGTPYFKIISSLRDFYR